MIKSALTSASSFLFLPTLLKTGLSKPQAEPHCKNLWKTLIKSASKLTAGKCPQRDITCADGHENVVGIEFSVEAAEVRRAHVLDKLLIFL